MQWDPSEVRLNGGESGRNSVEWRCGVGEYSSHDQEWTRMA